MNDKDKEAFEKWFYLLGDSHLERVIKLNRGASYEAWQAACEYKQKEIDDLQKELVFVDSITVREVLNTNKKLQAENAKLRECVEFYAVNGLASITVGQSLDVKLCQKFYINGSHARQVLKELE